MKPAPIYLDYQASTPVDSRVRDAMMPWLGTWFGNPHAMHDFGRRAASAVAEARQNVADVLHASAEDVVFTSGATEANNLAIKGTALFQQEQGGQKRHCITVATEHASVREAMSDVQRQGFRVTVLPVQSDGRLDLSQLAAAMTPDTLLVSVMAVNNECGVIQDMAAIGALCRSHGVWLHCDAAQAFGKIPLDVEAMQIDMLSISGHKTYAPQGVGALYLRRRPRVRIAPILSGGGQERGLRAGTVATPLVVALGEAARIAHLEQQQENSRLEQLRQRFLQVLDQAGCQYRIIGSMEHRVAGNLLLAFPQVTLGQEALLESMTQVAVSAGAACGAGGAAHSPVLRALGVKDAVLRIGFGRGLEERDVYHAALHIAAAVESCSKHG